jgi:hypothetical protein
VPSTHKVRDQPPPLSGYNVYDADPVLAQALHREGGGWGEEWVRALGALAGGEDAIALGEQADLNPPRLRTHDRYGRRVDQVEFHPPGTGCSAPRSSTACTPRRGETRGPGPRWPGRLGSTSGPRSRPATAAR